MKLFDIAVSALFPSTCVVCNEIIEDGENGLTVPCNNEEALADAIVYLAQNPEKRKLLIKQNRRMMPIGK